MKEKTSLDDCTFVMPKGKFKSEEEKSLDKRIITIKKEQGDLDVIWFIDVKEFIRQTEKDMRNSKLSRIGMVERFRKRAGEKLTDEK